MTEQVLISDYFKEDHDRLDDLFRKFQEMREKMPEKAGEFFKPFKMGLEQHILWEEQILFPLFEQRTGMIGQGPTVVMRLEHQEIKKLLSEIDSGIRSQKAETTGQAQTLSDILGEHNAKEEQILYPMIDEAVSEKERQEILEKVTIGKNQGGCSCCGVSG